MKMSKYPMTYEEYEQRVIELFVNTYPDDKQDIIIDRLDNALKEDPNLIEVLYGMDCFRYDNPQLYGENVKNIFDDYSLESTPVNTLHQLLGGNFE